MPTVNAYATAEQVAARLGRTFTEAETSRCNTLLEDAKVIIDATGTTADLTVKSLVSCRVVCRIMGADVDMGVPIGASQGSMSALGYSQSWTIGASGAAGEMYLSKLDKKLLGLGNRVGSYSPTEELVPCVESQ